MAIRLDQIPWPVEHAKQFGPPATVGQALAPHQVASTRAYATMLGACGIIETQVCQRILDAVDAIEKEILSGNSFASSSDPDLYSGLRRRLSELLGETASYLDIGKSPNDQLATDTRLWLREAYLKVTEDLLLLRQKLLLLARRDIEVLMPGYTHLQPAVPELLSHWWLASAERLERDQSRLKDLYSRLNICPLGAHAFAGATQPIDRNKLAELLHFDGVIENSLDAVSDRDFVVEFACTAALIGVHVSQLSSELLIWSTREFGYVRLPRAFTFRAQSFPQKRNPELLEILRARSAHLTGRLTQFLGELKGLTVSYSHDLEESLPGLVDVVENLHFILDLTSVVLPAMIIDTKRMNDAASIDAANSASAMDFLIESGFSPDKASEIVEKLLDYCKDRNKQFIDLTLGEWQQFSPAFNNEIYNYVTNSSRTDRRDSFGGTAQWQVEAALERCQSVFARDRNWLDEVGARILNRTVADKNLSQ